VANTQTHRARITRRRIARASIEAHAATRAMASERQALLQSSSCSFNDERDVEVGTRRGGARKGARSCARAEANDSGDDREDGGGALDDERASDRGEREGHALRRRSLSAYATGVLAIGAFVGAGATARSGVAKAKATRTASALGSSLNEQTSREVANLNAFTGSSFEHATGVALNGWLQLEDWFFANGETTIVDSAIGASQGVVLPPMFSSAEALGFKWSSEGELTANLAERFGEEEAVQAISAHRVDFLTNADLEKIKVLGFQTLRVPITWAAFQGTEENPTRLVPDPVYDDRALVSLDKEEFTNVLRTVHRATGSTVLIDMHNMPGGSSAGTYNGVFPHKPVFWDDEKVQLIGLHSVRKMLEWYDELAESDKDFVDGFTLLNEPAHLLPEKKDVMLAWMAKAIYMYRELVVRPCEAAKRPVPKLYVNLMNTAGIAQNEYGKLMASWFDQTELDDWAVLDLHFYLAWGNTGCESGCAFKCSDPLQQIAANVRTATAAFIGSIKRPAETYGVKRFSIGEWSLATHHDSKMGCSDSNVLQTIYQSQLRAFKSLGTKNFFWGWKMPHGGLHEDYWSMDTFQSRSGTFTSVSQSAIAMSHLGAVSNSALGEMPVPDAATMDVVTSLLGKASIDESHVVRETLAPQPKPAADVKAETSKNANAETATSVSNNAVASSGSAKASIVASKPATATGPLAPVHVDSISTTQVPASAQPQARPQVLSSVLPQAQPQVLTTAQPHVWPQAQPQVWASAQPKPQSQVLTSAQPQPQPQVSTSVQPPVQTPVQPQAAAQSQFAPVHVDFNPYSAVQAQVPQQPQLQAATVVQTPVAVQPVVLPIVQQQPAQDKPVVFASDRRDGSFWATAYGLDALKPATVHKNAFMVEDARDVDESEYYEEPRELLAARTGRALPTYADDAKDNLHQHRSTYSMHDAKNMKTGKVSYDLFSREHQSRDDDDLADTGDEDIDVSSIDMDNLMVGADDFSVPASRRAASAAEKSVEYVPSKKSTHSKHSTRDEDDEDDKDVLRNADRENVDENDVSWIHLAGRDLEDEESRRERSSSSTHRKSSSSSSSHRDDDDDDDDDARRSHH